MIASSSCNSEAGQCVRQGLPRATNTRSGRQSPGANDVKIARFATPVMLISVKMEFSTWSVLCETHSATRSMSIIGKRRRPGSMQQSLGNRIILAQNKCQREQCVRALAIEITPEIAVDDAHTRDDSLNGRERSEVQTGETSTKDTGKPYATETLQETPRNTTPPNFGKSQRSTWKGRFTTAIPSA